MPYTYAQAQCLRMRHYFDVTHRGLRDPLDPVRVRAIIVQHKDRRLPRNPNGLFQDCPAPASGEASEPLYEVMLLSTPCFPCSPTTEFRMVTLSAHCLAHQLALRL